jgi:hypothetical protein
MARHRITDQPRTANGERPAVEHQTSNIKGRRSNIDHQTSTDPPRSGFWLQSAVERFSAIDFDAGTLRDRTGTVQPRLGTAA